MDDSSIWPEKPSVEFPYFWGRRFINFTQARQHFLSVGSTGSGKSIAVNLLMKSVLSNITKGSGRRALVYDSKTDLVSLMSAMNPKLPTVILNPMDVRCFCWDMAQDLTEPMYFLDFAKIIIPASKSGNEADSYFSQNAALILSGIMNVFHEKAKGLWRFRDVILAMQSLEVLKTVLSSSIQTEHLVRQHLEQEKTTDNILSTLATHAEEYRPIAAAWELAAEYGRKFSIRDWMRTESVLVMGNRSAAKAPIQRLNNTLFSAITKKILDEPGYIEGAENWFFLDEVAELGKLTQLKDLMARGRSKGAAVVMAIQDVFDMDSVYGKEVSRALLGNAQNLSIHHISSSQPDTQKWAADVYGKQEVLIKLKSQQQGTTDGKHSASTSENEQLRRQTVWMESEFATKLPQANPMNNHSGLYGIGSHWRPTRIKWSNLFPDDPNRRLPQTYPKRVEGIKDFEPFENTVASQLLKPWFFEDFSRLSIPRLHEVVRGINSDR